MTGEACGTMEDLVYIYSFCCAYEFCGPFLHVNTFPLQGLRGLLLLLGTKD